MIPVHSGNVETIASYVINNKPVNVVICWQGKEPEADRDRFYDIFDSSGACLNEGEPWHDDGEGVPSEMDVREALQSRGEL